ncbi:YigZ family protein [Compostibacter hankyongensis]|uniref:IMPACT family protein n=1 Tax=Compostibacter hankyongensis TaxID=1007089 RepID=A0ABP8G436_9BACT
METHSYLTIERNAEAEFKDRGSRFLAFAFPVSTPEAVKERLQSVRKEHPKASHHCFAYRLGTEGLLFRVSDAGEPSGTAGKPILGQIDRRGLTDVLVTVVRYFGGTLLGVPGLIQAYRSAAALALQLTPAVRKQIEETCELQFDYTTLNQVLQTVRQYRCSIQQQELQLFCSLRIGIPVNKLQDCLKDLKGIPNLEIAFRLKEGV